MTRLTALITAILLSACTAPELPEGERINGIDWKLMALNGLPYPFDVSLRLDGDRLSGVLPCNAYSGGRDGTPPAFAATDLEVTEMACADQERRMAEAEYMSILPRLMTVERDGNQLRLTGPDAVLSFERREARGDEVF